MYKARKTFILELRVISKALKKNDIANSGSSRRQIFGQNLTILLHPTSIIIT